MSAVIDAEASKPKAKRGLQCQPLEVLEVPGARLNRVTVEAIVGRKKTWLYDEIKEGRFPPSDNHKQWLSDDVRAYLRARQEGKQWNRTPDQS
jgi:predicted DNA-binding transcriptional regulator AlpA